MQWSFGTTLGVVEANHVGAARVLKVALVCLNHRPVAQQLHSDFELFLRQLLAQKMKNDSAQMPDVDLAVSLPVADQQDCVTHYWPLG